MIGEISQKYAGSSHGVVRNSYDAQKPLLMSPVSIRMAMSLTERQVIAAANRLRKEARVVSMTLKRKNLARQLDELAREGFGAYAVFRAGAGAPEVKPLVARAPDARRADA